MQRKRKISGMNEIFSGALSDSQALSTFHQNLGS